MSFKNFCIIILLSKSAYSVSSQDSIGIQENLPQSFSQMTLNDHDIQCIINSLCLREQIVISSNIPQVILDNSFTKAKKIIKFLQAVINNDIDKVKLSLDSGTNINSAGPTGYTALHCAAFFGLEDMTKFLLKQANININAINRDNITPLHLALYPKGSSIYSIFYDGTVRARRDNLGTPVIVDLLLRSGANTDRILDTAKSRTKHYCIKFMKAENKIKSINNKTDFLSAMLNHESLNQEDPSNRNSDNSSNNDSSNSLRFKSILTDLSQFRQQQVCEGYYKKKSDDAKELFIKTYGMEILITKFIEYKNELFQAVIENNLETLKKLATQANFYIKNNDGETLLHLAIEQQNTKTIRFIINTVPHLLLTKNKAYITPLDLLIKKPRILATIFPIWQEFLKSLKLNNKESSENQGTSKA